MEPIKNEAVPETPKTPVEPVEPVRTETQDDFDFYEHQKRNIQKVDHLIEEAEQSLNELKRGLHKCSTVCQGSQVEGISEDSSESCECNDDLRAKVLIAPHTSEENFVPQLELDALESETNMFVPEDAEDEGEEESHLNTISEKTEEMDKSIASDLSSHLIEEKEPVKKLTIQYMPPISIGRPLTLQKIFQIDIQPNGITNMSDPLIHNIHYEEVSHNESKGSLKSEIVPYTLDTKIILDVSEDDKNDQSPLIAIPKVEELVDDEEESQVDDAITSAIDIEENIDKNKSRSDIIKDQIPEVIKIPSDTFINEVTKLPTVTEAPDIIDADLSKDIIEETDDESVTEIKSSIEETMDSVKEENADLIILTLEGTTTIPTETKKSGIKACGCDDEGNPLPESVKAKAEIIITGKETTVSSESKKPGLKELCDCKVDQKPPTKTLNTNDDELVPKLRYTSISDFEISTDSSKSVLSALDVLSAISKDDAPVHQVNDHFDSSVSSKEKLTDDFESAESVYVLTHDVSVQASPDARVNRKTDAKDIERESTPKAIIRFSDPRNSRNKNIDNAAIKRISDIKDNIKKKFSDEADKAILFEDATSSHEESNEEIDSNKNADAHTVMTVNVQYSNKIIQKAFEQLPMPGVKLHRSKCCRDVDTTTSYDSESYSCKNKKKIPYRNTPCGDNMTSSDYLKLCPNGRYIADDCCKSPPQNDSINEIQKNKFSKLQVSFTSSDSTSYKCDQTLSEGEINCKCSKSIGELHICRYAQEIKKQTQYLRKYPEKLLKHKVNENYEQGYNRATSTSTSPIETDSNDYSSDS